MQRGTMVSLALRIASSLAYFLFVVPCHLLLRGSLARNSIPKLDLVLKGISKGPIAHRSLLSVISQLLTCFIGVEVLKTH